MISGFQGCEIEPCVRFHARGGACLVFFLSLCPSPALARAYVGIPSLPLSQKKKEKSANPRERKNLISRIVKMFSTENHKTYRKQKENRNV